MKPSSNTAKEQIKKTLRYLSKRKDKVDYGSFKLRFLAQLSP